MDLKTFVSTVINNYNKDLFFAEMSTIRNVLTELIDLWDDIADKSEVEDRVKIYIDFLLNKCKANSKQDWLTASIAVLGIQCMMQENPDEFTAFTVETTRDSRLHDIYREWMKFSLEDK